MKKIKTLVLVFLLLTINIVPVYASSSNDNSVIKIDGKFEEWADKPYITDEASDTTGKGEDLKELRYFSDEEYLYLYIERYDSKQGWDLRVPIINGKGYESSNFFPWDNEGKESWEWTSQKVTSFNIYVDYNDTESKSRINVKLGNASIGEQYVFSNTDGTKIEVRLPLDKIGLAGPNKEIIFAVSSNINKSNDKIDWIPEKGPIHNTTGPVFGAFTPIAVLASAAFVGIITKKKYKKR